MVIVGFTICSMTLLFDSQYSLFLLLLLLLILIPTCFTLSLVNQLSSIIQPHLQILKIIVITFTFPHINVIRRIFTPVEPLDHVVISPDFNKNLVPIEPLRFSNKNVRNGLLSCLIPQLGSLTNGCQCSLIPLPEITKCFCWNFTSETHRDIEFVNKFAFTGCERLSSRRRLIYGSGRH